VSIGKNRGARQTSDHCVSIFLHSSFDAELKEAKETHHERWMALLLIRGSDQSKYGSILKGMMSQYSMSNDQYPRNVQQATDILSNHKLDQKFFDHLKKNREQRIEQRNKQDEEKQSETSFAPKNQDAICSCCGKKGHTSPNCDQKDKFSRDQWYIQRVMMQDIINDRSSVDDSDDRSVRSDRSTSSSASRNRNKTRKNDKEYDGFQQPATTLHQANKFENLKNVIILDTGSTIAATFMNPDLVTDIKVSKQPMEMSTNAGKKQLKLQGTVNGFGKVWFDSNQLANVFGVAQHLVDKHRITYDSDKEDAFIVYGNKKKMKFARTPEGLYAYQPPDTYFEEVARKKNKIVRCEPDCCFGRNCLANYRSGDLK
jgi:hypothetical protein